MEELTLELNLDRQDIPQDRQRGKGIIEKGLMCKQTNKNSSMKHVKVQDPLVAQRAEA